MISILTRVDKFILIEYGSKKVKEIKFRNNLFNYKIGSTCQLINGVL